MANSVFVEGNIQNNMSETSLSLWNSTVDVMNEIANDELNLIRKQEVTRFETLTSVGRASGAVAISADETKGFFVRDSYSDGKGISEVDLKTKAIKNLTTSPVQMGSTLRFIGNGLIYSKIDQFEEFKQYSDIYFYDPETHMETQLSSGLRASDPDASSDFSIKDKAISTGQIVFVKNGFDANQSLVKWDGKKETVIYQGKDFESLSQPTWGRGLARDWIIFIRKAVDHNHELLLIHSDSKTLKKVSVDSSPNHRFRIATPSFNPNGDLLFSASIGGVANIYQLKWKDLEKGNKPQRLTHFESGAYYPLQGKNGQHFAMVYGPHGFDVATYQPKIQNHPVIELKNLKERLNSKKDDSHTKSDLSAEIKKEDYSVFPAFWPKYIRPYAQAVQNGFVLGANSVLSDSLGQHWLGVQGAWDSRAEFPLYQVGYQFSGLYPTIELRNHQDNQYIQRLLASNRDNTWDLVFGYPLGDNFLEFGGTWTHSQFLAQTAASGGLKVSYGYGSSLAFPNSIDHAGATGNWWKFTLGGYFVGDEQYSTFEGWIEKRIPVFWPRHFLRITLSGAKFSNRSLVTAYAVGGTTGFVAENALYQLRGYPSGVILGRDIAVANVEYWLPLFDLFHGVGVIPFFYNRAKLRIFMDAGSGEYINGAIDNFSTWPISVGAHLMQDITLLFKFPITFAMGVDWGVRPELGGQLQFVVGAFGKFPM
jgi:hypothetical protein